MARRKSATVSNSLARIATRPEQSGQLLEAGLDSAFAIARGSVEALMQRVPGLAADEARSLHQRASALAVLAARHWREERLTAREKTRQPWRSGLRSLIDGPTFENLFSPSWDDNCPPGSIEATTSPAAYLTALYQWAIEVIEPLANHEEDTPIPLAERRPDLAGLMLDNHALERVEPTIGIVNEILERSARKHLDDHNLKTRSVDDALLEARYPFGLPFERYMSQINGILHSKQLGLGDLTRQLDPEFPYFCRGGLHSLRSDDALQLDTALGPEQRALLLEAAYFPRGVRRVSVRSVQTHTNPRSLLREPLHTLQAGFYPRHYGVAKAEDLLPLSAFCLRSGLDQDGVESLLSIQRHAPVASPNVPGLAAATPARFGSVYINAATEPAIGVSSSGGEHQFSDWANDHFDRMQRMTRLARWLELPFGDADRLLDAALQAEYGDAGRGEEITENTLRALGLFRRLRRDFKVSAEDFAALLQGVALYARGNEVPQFDRVFNDPALFSEPLVLDDTPFSIVPGSDAEYRKINHLCAALGMDYETYLYLARYIAQAWGQETLRSEAGTDTLYWSHAVVSAFYRLARLPAWLGLTSIEALALLQLIGDRGHQYVSRLVRTSLAIHQHSDLSDTLSVIQSLVDVVQWCRAHELSVAWLYQHLIPLAPVAAASDRELDLLRQINGRMLPTILDEAKFRDAGLPMIAGADLPTPIEWLKQLRDFISERGLILASDEYQDDEAYEAALKQRLEKVVDDLGLAEGPAVIVRAFQLVMGGRSAQHSLVHESLASTFGASAELSEEVLGWAGGSSYQLLVEVLRLFNGDTEPLPIPIGDDVLALFARLGHRMGIVAQLSLSPLAVRSWRLHPEWFEGQGGADTGEITFAHLHLLTQYRYLLTITRQAEQAVLDYLKLVNGLPPDLTEQDLHMIREDAAGKISAFTGFGIRDILETAGEITANGIIANLRQLDHLVRVRQLCEALQLGSSAALALGRLRSNSPRQEYRAAAESALSSLLEQDGQALPPVSGELGQSEASWLLVDTELLVANAGGRARCLLTVKNFVGQPLEGITVTWHTDLSTLGTPSSTVTDGNGQVENHLLAGDEMGTAQVVARFGLDRQVLAPLIRIDCDDHSLRVKDPACSPQEALAGNLQMIDYRLQVVDDYGNPGSDRVIEWSTNLGNFERPQTRADANGFASAHLRSLSAGKATVIALLPVNGEEETFDEVTFLEQRYFQYVRFSGPVATTQVATVTCRVVRLDGHPQSGVTIMWSADMGGFEEATSITDNKGVASIGYISEEAGAVTVTAKAFYDSVQLIPLSSEPTTIHDLPRLVEMEPAEQYFVLSQSKAAGFYVRLEPAAAMLPVTWWRGQSLLGTTYTSADGRAEFHHHFTAADVGEQTVTVRSIRNDDDYDFKVMVSEAHTALEVTLPEDNPQMVAHHNRIGFVIDQGGTGELLIRAVREGGVGDDKARLMLGWADDSIDPAVLAMAFDPPLGQYLQCDEDGYATLKIDASNAAFLPASDPYSNQFRLVLTSNLGIVQRIVGQLRNFVELAKTPMKVVEDSSDIVGICGYLKRLDGGPVQFRAESAMLRASPAGNPETGELTTLFSDSLGRTCFKFDHVAMTEDEKGGCHFYPEGDLARRLHFVGPSLRTFQAPERLSGIELEYELDSEVMLAKDDRILIDTRSTTRIRVIVRSGGKPASGVGYFRLPLNVRGATLKLADVLSDEEGGITIDVDTQDFSMTDMSVNDYDFSGRMGAFTEPMRIGFREFTTITGWAHFRDSGGPTEVRCDYTLHFARLGRKQFAPSAAFEGNAGLGSNPQWFYLVLPANTSVVGRIDATRWHIPGTLYVKMSERTTRFVLVGATSIPVVDETSASLDSAPLPGDPS